MSATTYNLELTWPIASPETVSLRRLRAEADASLTATLATYRLTPTSRAVWDVRHGHQPTIAARLTVTGPRGLPRHIEAAVGAAHLATEGAAA